MTATAHETHHTTVLDGEEFPVLLERGKPHVTVNGRRPGYYYAIVRNYHRQPLPAVADVEMYAGPLPDDPPSRDSMLPWEVVVSRGGIGVTLRWKRVDAHLSHDDERNWDIHVEVEILDARAPQGSPRIFRRQTHIHPNDVLPALEEARAAGDGVAAEVYQLTTTGVVTIRRAVKWAMLC